MTGYRVEQCGACGEMYAVWKQAHRENLGKCGKCRPDIKGPQGQRG